MMDRKTSVIAYWAGVLSAALLLTYAMQILLTIAVLIFVPASILSESAQWPLIIASSVFLLIASIFWFRGQGRPSFMIERSAFIAARLFLLLVLVVAADTIYQTISGQNASDPAGPAMAISLLMVFSVIYLAQAAIAYAVGFMLRRRRLKA